MEYDPIDYAKYRLSKAKEDFEAAKMLLNNDHYAQSLNRSYYSIFHAARTLAAVDKFKTKTHSGVIAYFNREYILPGKLDRKYGVIIKSAERIRIQSDYMDFYIASKEQSQTQLDNAGEFIKMIENYLENVLEK